MPCHLLVELRSYYRDFSHIFNVNKSQDVFTTELTPYINYKHDCIINATTLTYITPILIILICLWFKLKDVFASSIPTLLYSPKIYRVIFGGKPNYQIFQKLSEKYGGIFTLHTFKDKRIVLNNAKVVREAFNKGATFSGRSPNFSLDLVSDDYREALKIMHERNWKVLRHFAHKALITHGIKQSDDIISNEVDRLIERLNNKKGSSIDPTRDLMLAVVNISAMLVFGERFNFGDGCFECIEDIMSHTFNGKNNNLGKKLKNLYQMFMKKTKEKHQSEILLENFIKSHKTGEGKKSRSDIIDEVLRHINESEVKLNIIDEETKHYIAFSVIFEVFFSSLEPVLATIQWVLMYLARFEDQQEKVYEELMDSKAESNISTQLLAVMHETQRLATVVPLYPRTCTTNSTLSGHNIQKDTVVLINCYALHHDGNTWNEPEEFKPERWVDKNGNFKRINSESFIPFGGGQRRCIGEQMAHKELITVLTKLCKSFKVSEVTKNDFSPVEGTFNVPRNLKLLFSLR